LHDFFGNTSTDAYSTKSTLLAAATTCDVSLDRAAYWMPALFLSDGTLTEPDSFHAYYRVGSRENPEDFQSYPLGLKMIAGDSTATSAQLKKIMYWTCRGARSAPRRPVPFNCRSYGKPLEVHVNFPDCWDGVKLDSPDHMSHMAVADKMTGACPPGYPVHVPKLGEVVVYRIESGAKATLSSGGSFSSHADFFNAWTRPKLARLISRCLNANIACGTIGH